MDACDQGEGGASQKDKNRDWEENVSGPQKN